MRKVLLALLVLCLGPAAFADKPRLSLADFVVHSDNPKYKYLGKGVAELVAMELSKSPDVVLIEREQRTEVIREIQASLSDMADVSTQVRLGKMLAASHFLFGEIIDMGGDLLVTVRLTAIETGAVVFQDKLQVKPADYDFLAASFGRSVLTFLHAAVAKTTVAKVEAKQAKNEEALVALSRAVDAYDNKDESAARVSLDQARTLDPGNETVDRFLRKLRQFSPEFRVEIEKYSPTFNPAVLGTIRGDSFYTWFSAPFPFDRVPRNVGGGIHADEQGTTLRTGYLLPLGSNCGLGVELLYSSYDYKVNLAGTPYTYSYGPVTGLTAFQPHVSNLGGEIMFGWAPFDLLSVGASLYLFNNHWAKGTASAQPVTDELTYAIDLGVLFRLLDDNLTIDTHVVNTSIHEDYMEFDPSPPTASTVKQGSLPLTVELTVTGALFDRRLFLSLKGVGSFYVDQRHWVQAKAIPMVEWWPLDWLAVRLGGELSNFWGTDGSYPGYGVTAGLTLKVWKVDVNINYTYRLKALRSLPGYSFDESMVLIGVSLNELFVTR
jgi:TolB-like protein